MAGLLDGQQCTPARLGRDQHALAVAAHTEHTSDLLGGFSRGAQALSVAAVHEALGADCRIMTECWVHSTPAGMQICWSGACGLNCAHGSEGWHSKMPLSRAGCAALRQFEGSLRIRGCDYWGHPVLHASLDGHQGRATCVPGSWISPQGEFSCSCQGALGAHT